MRVKLLKNHKSYTKGQIVEVSPNVAFGLVDSGVAEITKDMVEQDYKTKGVKRGRTT